MAAAAQYPIDRHDSWEHYPTKITGWVDYAARRGAKLAVFPEYGAMELASLNVETMGDLDASLEHVSGLAPHVDALHIELARENNIHILASSMPIYRDGQYRNVARLFTPSGTMGAQEKIVMTRFEREQWKVHSGGPLRLFETAIGKIGVLICYDAEFPLLARALVEAGAEIILAPSCTDTLAGYNRVKIGAMARALEGQCYVLHAATVGEAGWSPAVDVNHGAAGIYGPADRGFPDNGVISVGELDAKQWVLGDIDLAKVAEVRKDGSVLNLAHWAEQPGAGELPEVELVAL
jgi:predicted amidohydrolase